MIEQASESARVLIVDDMPKNIQVLGPVLRKAGYQIFVAQNGEQAITTADSVHPDLILLDVMMPVMDGFTACKHLKANPDTADIPIIFLTAKVEKEDVIKGLELGAVDYVTKPFNAQELLTRVNTHLTLRSLQRQLEQRVDELGEALEKERALQKQIRTMQREHEAFLRHELKNNIGPVMGYADMLTRLSSGMNEKQLKWASKISESARRMTRLIDDLKKLQDFERGQFDIETQPCDLDDLVQQVVQDLTPSFSGYAYAQYHSDAIRTIVMADEGLLEGVYRNLIKNALEHVADLDEDALKTVQISLGNANDQVVFQVNNGGPPIPADRLDFFFEKFNSGKVKKGGTGLGTTYAYLVTKAHQGTIEVTSTEAEGTTVMVCLPCKP